LAFIGLIYAATISGLEALVLTTDELKTLTTSLSKKLKFMTRGRLNTTNEDEIRQPSEATLWRYWKLLPPGPELTIRRLRWLQSLARFPQDNEQLLAVLFGVPRVCEEEGRTTLDNEGKIIMSDDTHPWAKQCATDLETIMATEEGHNMDEEWHSRDIRQLFTDDYCNEVFCRLDVNLLRSQHLTTRWAPEVLAAQPDEENPPLGRGGREGAMQHHPHG